MLRRKDIIIGRWMKNGDIRFYRDDDCKSGVPELVFAHEKNVMYALVCGNVNKVIIEYEHL